MLKWAAPGRDWTDVLASITLHLFWAIARKRIRSIILWRLHHLHFSSMILKRPASPILINQAQVTRDTGCRSLWPLTTVATEHSCALQLNVISSQDVFFSCFFVYNTLQKASWCAPFWERSGSTGSVRSKPEALSSGRPPEFNTCIHNPYYITYL